MEVANMERTILGQVFLPSVSIQESVTARLLSGPQVRQEFFSSEKDKMSFPLRKALLEAFQTFFGDSVQDLQMRYSVKAGCSTCPCSPGFHLSGIPAEGPLGPRGLIQEVFGFPTRERFFFFVDTEGRVSVRSPVMTWEGRQREIRHKELCTLVTSLYQAPKKAERTHWLPPAPGTQMHLPFANV